MRTDDEKRSLERISARGLARFEREERLLSFTQYLAKLAERPHLLARNATQYLADAIDYFGTELRRTPAGEKRRYRVFDGVGGSDALRVVGNERAQHDFLRLLDNFRREGHVNRLIVIHGPNGSAKTSFVDALFQALEAYSRTEEGAMYRFNWVFPVRTAAGGSIGFGGQPGKRDTLETYAFLADDAIDAKLPSEHNDNPIFLLPRAERLQMLEELTKNHAEFHLSRTIRGGALGHRSRKIFDALMAAYQGDLDAVLKHVQVERLFISRRYRRAAVTVEPQLRIDAGVRQLTVDRSLSALPKVLQSQTLFEVSGPLAEGNRGMIEFSDFLKRPLEANKYLLATGEKGTVSLENRVIHLDSLLVATANDTYLNALKHDADWSSYRGRIELVRMGYLLDYRQEALIYDDLLASIHFNKPLAPHTTEMMALWAVMTRLKRPSAEGLSATLQRAIEQLAPLEKALLYADGTMPEWLGPEEKQLLKAALPELIEQGQAESYYEGGAGVSPRELKGVLLDELHSESSTLSPWTVVERLETLLKDPSMFEWLRIEPVGRYHRPAAFLEDVRRHYLDQCEREVRVATGLIEEGAPLELFRRYILHANAFLKEERLYDPRTGQTLDPDAAFMAEMERRFDRKLDVVRFRSEVLARIAAFGIEHPRVSVDYETIFPDLLARLENAYFLSKRAQIEEIWADLLAYYDEDTAGLGADRLERAKTTHARLARDFGYVPETAREVVSALLAERLTSHD